jgi:hypothetical protein
VAVHCTSLGCLILHILIKLESFVLLIVVNQSQDLTKSFVFLPSFVDDRTIYVLLEFRHTVSVSLLSAD